MHGVNVGSNLSVRQPPDLSLLCHPQLARGGQTRVRKSSSTQSMYIEFQLFFERKCLPLYVTEFYNNVSVFS